MKAAIIISACLLITLTATVVAAVKLGDQAFTADKFNQAGSWYKFAEVLAPFIPFHQRRLALQLAREGRGNAVFEAEDASIAASPLQKYNRVLGVRTLVPVLMYHYIRVNPNPNDRVGFNLSVTPDNFSAQMQYLADHGYHSLSPDELGAILLFGAPPPNKPVVITFDDGYADSYTAAFPVLKSHGFKGMNFLITGLIGAPNYLTWAEIKDMRDSGVFTFGAHTVHHYALTYLDNFQLRTEIADSKSILEKNLGTRTNWFAYPYGNVNSRVAQAVRDAGFVGAFGTANGLYQSTDYMFTLPRIRVGGGENLAGFASRLPWQ